MNVTGSTVTPASGLVLIEHFKPHRMNEYDYLAKLIEAVS